MDPLTNAIVAVGSEKVSERTAGFLRRVAGPAADEIGLLLQDRVRLYRFRNQLRMADKAAEWVAASGKPITTIPLRVLLPLLEGGSLEEEPPLADMWAALLARAATSADKQAVLPTYPSILRQLSPMDAHVLEVLYRWRPDPLGPSGREWGPEISDLCQLASFDEKSELDLLLDNLTGLGLVERRPSFFSAVGDDGKERQMMTTKRAFRLTTLGRRFVVACADPNRQASYHEQREIDPAVVVGSPSDEGPASEQLPSGLYLSEPEFVASGETESHYEIQLSYGHAVEEIWGAVRQISHEPDSEVWEKLTKALEPFFVIGRLQEGRLPTIKVPKPLPGDVTVYIFFPYLLDEESGRFVSGYGWSGALRHTRESSA